MHHLGPRPTVWVEVGVPPSKGKNGLFFGCNPGGGNRTHTTFRSTDFKSVASAVPPRPVQIGMISRPLRACHRPMLRVGGLPSSAPDRVLGDGEVLWTHQWNLGRTGLAFFNSTLWSRKYFTSFKTLNARVPEPAVYGRENTSSGQNPCGAFLLVKGAVARLCFWSNLWIAGPFRAYRNPTRRQKHEHQSSPVSCRGRSAAVAVAASGGRIEAQQKDSGAVANAPTERRPIESGWPVTRCGSSRTTNTAI